MRGWDTDPSTPGKRPLVSAWVSGPQLGAHWFLRKRQDPGSGPLSRVCRPCGRIMPARRCHRSGRQRGAVDHRCHQNHPLEPLPQPVQPRTPPWPSRRSARFSHRSRRFLKAPCVSDGVFRQRPWAWPPHAERPAPLPGAGRSAARAPAGRGRRQVHGQSGRSHTLGNRLPRILRLTPSPPKKSTTERIRGRGGRFAVLPERAGDGTCAHGGIRRRRRGDGCRVSSP